jgi:L-lysine 6-oxidase
VILGVTDSGEVDPKKRKEKAMEELEAAGASAGQQVNYIRGIQNHVQMVYAWSYLGFIVNQNEGDDRNDYPYFVEKERNHEEFGVIGMAANNKINIVDPENTRFTPGYYLKKSIVDFTKSEE